ncbi:hypothetical protein OIDMADRAFT_15942 [Oidiodendron maius Zn]|uniref:Uncharacterized protein n=1 Tax=Oidiodendron maius (strain Zn) TaxID=913774 RepID=A0A0C3D6D4_OIDMZ|nr:hypothetical protein OIDMADRAFT_15942 [Oidiodendron maius Zn]
MSSGRELSIGLVDNTRCCEDGLPSGQLCDERKRSGNAQNDWAEGKGSEAYTRLHGELI